MVERDSLTASPNRALRPPFGGHAADEVVPLKPAQPSGKLGIRQPLGGHLTNVLLTFKYRIVVSDDRADGGDRRIVLGMLSQLHSPSSALEQGSVLGAQEPPRNP